MSSNLHRPIRIEVTIKGSQPQLLEGLDVWLCLGLLNDAQVRQLCRESLACPLPQPVAATTVSTPQVRFPTESLDFNQDFVTESAKSESSQPPKLPVGMLHSLMTELSLRWLLFLGVFMVVVSSGVLAASQWQKFPAAGQYGILLGYTLIFWGVSFWAGRQPNLQLTAQTLQIVTLLLVPVNFWAIDSFGLWQHPLDWITVVIATVALTAVTVLLLKNRLPASSVRLRQLKWLPILNILSLSYLHWGWRLPEFPLIAVYSGMVGTCLITLYQTRYRQQQLSPPQAQSQQPPLSLGAGVVVYALVILLVRAIFVVHLDVRQLGLAIGICGWLVAWRMQVLWEMIGGSLLLLGWLVSVGTKSPWQASAVSGLGLWFFAQRLQRFWQRADLTAFLGIGLQTLWLVWRLVPPPVQEWAIATGTQLTGSENVPWALLSLALFPYLILIVLLTDWLYRASQPALANLGEQLALGFGVVLTLISLANPTLRSLNLLFSTVTLGIVTPRRSPTRVSQVYLTHIMGVLTLGSTINWLYPNLSWEVWASILLVVMVAEWGFSLGNGLALWRRSSWHIGLGLAALSYSLLWYPKGFALRQWGILWLITPLALTGVASQTVPPRRLISSWLSVAALGIAQLLTLTLPGARLIGLGVATGLMLLNTRYLRHLAAAAITVGFGLSFTGMLLWDGVPGVPRLSAPGWFLVGAITIISLWLLRGRLIGRPGTLATIYAQANDGWAITLCSLELILLTVHSLGVYWAVFSPDVAVLIATALTMGAIAYRSWQQPDNWAFYGLGWGLELLSAQALGFAGRSVVNLVIANIALGIMTQLLGEAWRWRHRVGTVPSSWHILPLLYGVLSVVLRWGTFTSWTGLCSLGVALIAIGVGRRRHEFKPLVYLGMIGVSVCAYELLFYQLLQVPGAAFGDELIAMSALGTSIMYAYRVLSPWLIDYLGLRTEELKFVAHFDWAWSSCLLLAAIVSPIESSKLVGLGTGVFLIQYAIFQGRHHLNPRTAEIWVYLGLFEVAGIRNYWLYTALGRLFSGPRVPWKAPIACVLAYFLYILPWETWGWPTKPWQRAAVVLPLIMMWETRGVIHPVSLLITAGFYVLIARLKEQIRFTYISVALVDWALWRWFSDLHLNDALWYITLIGLSLLYVAQFDPGLKLPQQKQTRHNLRLLGTGAICGFALLFHQDTGLQPGILSILAIFAGLALRVPAFLYVGTATFLLNAFYQLVVLILRHPFFKWVIGLLVGITFIWIAGNFEARRAQLTSLVRNWIAQLQEWQ